ncbi:hypothetical protein QJS04_geneDACA014905 [Acorus gramineus]|uniref:Uncharacterized protein n=1 Tax=Acorus gramineus TaxID=55184 RepID=A0AAV9BT47_ACOGR|nr:hypothetical protein QJS04_geneDACA014905 [Acorus gramineus]
MMPRVSISFPLPLFSERRHPLCIRSPQATSRSTLSLFISISISVVSISISVHKLQSLGPRFLYLRSPPPKSDFDLDLYFVCV